MKIFALMILGLIPIGISAAATPAVKPLAPSVAVVPPPANMFTSIMSILRTPLSFSTLITELNTTKLDASVLEKSARSEDVTLFAPTDDAFNKFGLLGAVRANPDDLKKFLQFHMLHGRWDRKKLKSRSSAKTLANKDLKLKTIPSIVCSIEVDNGIIHVVNGILVHPDVQTKLSKLKA